MKAYTNLEQSKKLVEILPLKSADMRFCFSHTFGGRITGHYPMIGSEPSLGTIPCWSLSALLNYIKDNCDYFELVYINNTLEGKANELKRAYRLSTDVYDVYEDELIDACYEMIIQLHEQNIL